MTAVVMMIRMVLMIVMLMLADAVQMIYVSACPSLLQCYMALPGPAAVDL